MLPAIKFTGTKITPTALEALRKAEITATGDHQYALDTFQMGNRKDYESFKAVITSIKGRWNGKTHLFPYNPAEAIEVIVESGFIPVHNPYSLFETPESGVNDLFLLLGIDSPGLDGKYYDGQPYKFLEPSAGTGRIANQIKRRFPFAQVDVCEIDPFNQLGMAESGFNIIADDFLKMETSERYDFILMNPPFNGTEYIDHVLKAFSLLKEHGKLAAIVPSGFLFGSTKKIVKFRNFCAEFGDWEVFDHEFENTKVKCHFVTLEKHSEKRLAELWSDHYGRDSWFHYQAELALDNEREFHNEKERIAKLPKDKWAKEILSAADRIVARLIQRESYCLLWDDRVKNAVVADVSSDLEGWLESDSEAETEAAQDYKFEPSIPEGRKIIFAPVSPNDFKTFNLLNELRCVCYEGHVIYESGSYWIQGKDAVNLFCQNIEALICELEQSFQDPESVAEFAQDRMKLAELQKIKAS